MVQGLHCWCKLYRHYNYITMCPQILQMRHKHFLLGRMHPVDYCAYIYIVFPALCNLKLCYFRLNAILKKLKKMENNIFETHTKFFLAGMKVQWDEWGRKILLAINTGNKVVRVWLIRYQCVGVWMSTGRPYMYTYSSPYVL